MSAQTVTRPEAATATIIDSPARAEVLAEHLLDPKRLKPVVVVTIAAGQSAPYIDVDQVIGAVSDLADVYVLPTGTMTFALSDRMPQKTQVYGGAGRVYPVDRTWQTNPYAAPLRFAFCAAQGLVATDKLIADALGAVHEAGLSGKRVGATVVRVEGAVTGLIAPSRAWVRIDDGGDAAIWQDLLLPRLALERTFQVGMRISGALDVEERRIDVSAALRKSRDALADYSVGAVVLGRVVQVDDIAACVELYPGARTGMSPTEVTGNPKDRLSTLMSLDEVLLVRVIARGGHDGRGWRLSMLDVEDSDEVLTAPSMLPGGPPWLVLADVAAEASAAETLALETLALETVVLETVALESIRAPTLVPVAPTPASSSVSAAPDSLALNGIAVPGTLPMALDERKTLLVQIAQLQAQLQQSQMPARAVQVERDGFREQASTSHGRLQELLLSAKKARTDLRIEKQKSQRLEKQLRSLKAQGNGASNADVLYLDPERQFRFEVDLEYAHRIPATDKATRPRRELRLGPDFLASLRELQGVDRNKVVAVTVEIITDLVNELDSREPHPLREGKGAAERDVIRAVDGGRCMRLALQTGTPSARRMHYWRVGDAIEMSRVVKHDDMRP
jgi:hypothetical protein